MQVITRTFFREHEGKRQFLEISWSGPEVEVVTGRLGANGRASSRSFDTPDERDAWIAARVTAALQQGFTEGSPADVPAAEPPTPDDDPARAFEALRRRLARPAWLPEFDGPDRLDGSKLGGVPWLGEPWPRCPSCTQPLNHVLQLRRDDLPEAMRWPFREPLLQLFLCNAGGKPGASQELCQSWDPFSPSSLVRHVRPSGPALTLADALPEAVRSRMAELEHAAQSDYGVLCGDPPLPPLAEHAKRARAQALLQVPSENMAYFTSRAWVYPPRPIAGWKEHDDLAAYGDVNLDELQMLEEHGLACLGGHKLGGWPAWVQDPLRVSCRACRKPMEAFAQVTTDGPLHIGADGRGWLFACRACGEATFAWQR